METATDEKVELANVFVVHECVRVGASISDRVGAACLKLLNMFELRQCLELKDMRKKDMKTFVFSVV